VADGDRVAVRLAAQQDNHFFNEFIYINRLPLQRAFLNSKLILLMMSAARVTSLTSLDAARVPLANRVTRQAIAKQVLGSFTAAEIGCLISCAREAVNRPSSSPGLSAKDQPVPAQSLALSPPLAFGHVHQDPRNSTTSRTR